MCIWRVAYFVDDLPSACLMHRFSIAMNGPSVNELNAALLAPPLDFSAQLHPLVSDIRHHLENESRLIHLVSLCDTVPHRAHQIHDSQKLVRQPSHDRAVEKCQKSSQVKKS